MKYCTKCGREMQDTSRFCPACGTKSEISPNSSTEINRNTNSSPDRNGVKILTQYLEKIVDLEKSVFTQTQAIEELKEYIDHLGFAQEFRMPTHPGDYTENVFANVFSLGGSGIVLGGLVGAFCGSFTTGAVLGALLLGGGTFAINMSHWSSVNNEIDRRHMNAVQQYKADVLEDEQRVEEELAEKERLIPIVHDMEEELKKTQIILDQYYEKNIIFSKYQNLVAMCSFYEYFISGRCSALTGHEGAYNIFENEVRLERIVSKLDEVIAHLDDIKANQYMLYNTIQEGNRISQCLIEESIRQSQLLERIEDNSETTAFYAKNAALCAEANASINLANYIQTREYINQ